MEEGFGILRVIVRYDICYLGIVSAIVPQNIIPTGSTFGTIEVQLWTKDGNCTPQSINKLLNKLPLLILCPNVTDKSLFDCRVLSQQGCMGRLGWVPW